jgi:hypothetical protein
VTALLAALGQPFSIPPYRSIVTGDLPRPYLVMNVTGINGRSGGVMGIVDSGADTTTFPFEYASLMGYSPATLTQETFTQAAGNGVGYRATQQCTAVVPEIPLKVVQMMPSFIQGAQMVLRGRTDFMRAFEVAFHETQQRFTITAIG